jgi:hypothetical protein
MKFKLGGALPVASLEPDGNFVNRKTAKTAAMNHFRLESWDLLNVAMPPESPKDATLRYQQAWEKSNGSNLATARQAQIHRLKDAHAARQ